MSFYVPISNERIQSMKKFLFPVLLIVAIGCAKKENAPAASSTLGTAQQPTLTPSETVVKVCDALVRHDSAAYVSLVSSSRRRAYAANPQLLSRTLEFWMMRKPSVEIISASQHDTMATVRYRLKIAGRPPVDVTDSTQLVLENGAWKYAR
jgi:hypothetical protein